MDLRLLRAVERSDKFVLVASGITKDTRVFGSQAVSINQVAKHPLLGVRFTSPSNTSTMVDLPPRTGAGVATG